MAEMPIAVIILMVVLISVVLLRTTKFTIPIWVIMLAGAIATVLFRQLSLPNAFAAIEPDVMIYLLGVFLISQAAEESGYLEHVTDNIFSLAHTGTQALFIIVFFLGLSASLLMNDTIAIVGTPIILQLCKKHKELAKPLLFALAFSITIGSVMTPIGNPQNLLIAVKSEMSSPFIDFIKPLAIPTIGNLIITFLYIYIFYKKKLREPLAKPIPSPINDQQTVTLVKISLLVMVILIFIKIMADFIHSPVRINFSLIAILAALPVFLSKQRWAIIQKLDWGTLIFFASTFVLMQSVWESGFFQTTINDFHLKITDIPIILIVSVIVSQFISNVPLVALYLPLLIHQSSLSHLLALAVGSTIAGNLSILGAASNIIIIQNSERRKIKGFGFFEFIKIGLPLTIINLLIYVLFLWK